MRKPHRILILVLCAFWLAGGLATAAWGKSYSKRQHKKKVEEPRLLTIPPPEVESQGTIIEADQPQTFLERASEQEEAGDWADSLQTLLKFINVHPGHSQRPAALLKAADLARRLGEIDKAIQLNDLTVFLKPDVASATRARRQAATLELYLRLPHLDPLAAMRQFLDRITPWPSGQSVGPLQEPLANGWQAVSQRVHASVPVPVAKLEELLALWDLHPPGSQPPEAALLLGELLQKQGLLAEARNFYQRLQEPEGKRLRTAGLVGLLEITWESGDLSAFASTLLQLKQNHGEITPELKHRLAQLPLPEDLLTQHPDLEKAAPGEPVDLLLSWWCGKTPGANQQAELLRSLEHFLRRPLPAAVKDRIKLELAQLQWSQGNFPQAAKLYQDLLANGAKGDRSAFYQDRLGLTQLKAQRPDKAQEIFHVLGQDEDHFWKLVSSTRLMDVELARAKMEPSHD